MCSCLSTSLWYICHCSLSLYSLSVSLVCLHSRLFCASISIVSLCCISVCQSVCLSVCLSVYYLDGSSLGFLSVKPCPQRKFSDENLNGLWEHDGDLCTDHLVRVVGNCANNSQPGILVLVTNSEIPLTIASHARFSKLFINNPCFTPYETV